MWPIVTDVPWLCVSVYVRVCLLVGPAKTAELIKVPGRVWNRDVLDRGLDLVT